MKMRGFSLIGILLLVLIIVRFFGQLMTYDVWSIIFTILYFLAFLGVYGEVIWGYWWIIGIGMLEILGFWMTGDIRRFFLLIDILLMILALTALILKGRIKI